MPSSSSTLAGISSQKLKLFRRANAMSGAPIINGTIQLARPVSAGISAPKIITRPCRVTSVL